MKFFNRILLGGDDREITVASIDDLRKQFDTTADGYWGFNESSLTDYRHGADGFKIRTEFFNGTEVVANLDRESWRSDPSLDRASDALAGVEEEAAQRVVFDAHIVDPFRGQFWRECFEWRIRVLYDYGGSGLVTGRLEYDIAVCPKGISDYIRPSISKTRNPQFTGTQAFTTIRVLPLALMLLVLISIVLSIKTQISRKEQPLLRNPHDAEAAKSNLSWFLFTLVSHFVQIAAVLACLNTAIRAKEQMTGSIGETNKAGLSVSTRNTLLGSAALLAWISLLRYLRYFDTYYVLIRTLTRAIPKVTRFVAGIAPIVIGYALFGATVFWESKFFSSVTGSVVSLFALLNGDVIHEAFEDVSVNSPFIGPIYLYSFLVLFMYVVLNVFLSIVEEAFFSAKEHEDRYLGRGIPGVRRAGNNLEISNRPLIQSIMHSIALLRNEPGGLHGLQEISNFIQED